MKTRFLSPSFVALALVLGCSTPAAQVCAPGAAVACVGPGGCAGGQTCNAAGTGFGACDCGGGQDAGGDRDGAVVDAASVDVDGATDSGGAVDAATVCDPLTHAGCNTDQRCTWIVDGTTGHLGCVPDGTVAEGGSCTVGPSGPTGYDDCSRGLVCANGTCRRACALAGGAGCNATQACVAYVGLFEPDTYGACLETCDPITQQRPDGSSCGAGRGCYVLFGDTETVALCAGAGTVPIGSDITGTAFANSCVPGGLPVPHPNGTGSYCTAFCAPVETSTAATGSPGGMAPHSCGDVGLTSSECLFAWFLSPSPAPDPRLDHFGYCFDRTGRMIDTDGDGTPDAPWPSCTTLAPTDTDGDGVRENVELGCGPLGT